SMSSRFCACMSRSAMVPVICSRRSARVLLPWSMWAMMQKLRMWSMGRPAWAEKGPRRYCGPACALAWTGCLGKNGRSWTEQARCPDRPRRVPRRGIASVAPMRTAMLLRYAPLACLLLLSRPGFAQGADGNGACSCWIQPDSTWTNLNPGPPGVPPAPIASNFYGYAGPIALPFAFSFFGQEEDSIYINSNGTLSFHGPYTESQTAP